MTGKLMFFALGYVLGTRAGRERFVQLAGLVKWAAGRDETQTAIGLAKSAFQVAVERGVEYSGKRAA